MGVFIFLMVWPLVISAGIILLVQKGVNHKMAGLVVSSAVILLTATSWAKSCFRTHCCNSRSFQGLHSDMNGFGAYRRIMAGNFVWH
jgi:hypothetical protein